MTPTNIPLIVYVSNGNENRIIIPDNKENLCL